MSPRNWRLGFRRAGFHRDQRGAAPSKRPLRLESLEARCLLSATRLDAQLLTGDVHNQYEVSADGRFGVYLADAEEDSRTELYSVEFTTGAVRNLSEDTLPGRVLKFQIGPNSTRVVYGSREYHSNQWEIYSVPLGGGESTALTGVSDGAGNEAREFVISPDGSRVVYLSDQERDDVYELYSVPIGGGTVAKLSDLRADHDVRPGFEVSADSSRVVYRAGQAVTDALYSVDLAGGQITKLSDLLPNRFPADDEGIVEISPDGSRAAYLSDSSLFTVPLASANSIQIGSEVKPGFQFSPDSGHVIFVAGDDLFRAPLRGGDSTQLNPSVTFSTVQPDAQISPDGSRVVYRADQDSNSVFELYSVPMAGGPTTKLNSTPVTGGDVAVHPGKVEPPVFQITPDSQHVVYFADERTDGDVELFSAPLAGGGSTKLSHVPFRVEWYASHLRPWDQRYPQVSPDGSHVVYIAERELFGVPVTGGAATKLNGPLVLGGEVGGLRFIPGSDRVLYRASQDTQGVWELYSAPLFGGDTTKHSGSILASGYAYRVRHARLSPDKQFALYLSRLDYDQVDELYRVDTTTGEIRQLSNGAPEGGVVSYEISGDGKWVVYRTANQLYSVPLAASGHVRLHDLPDDWLIYGEFAITSDSHRVVYTAGRLAGGFIDLYSVPLAGGEPTKLVERTDAESWWISPDNRWVVDSNSSGVFSVPLAGGPINKLHEWPLDRYSKLEISPDSGRVVFWGEYETERMSELFSVPIAGGDLIKLNEPLVSRGDVFADFSFSADGRRVVYLADQDVDEVDELFSVPTAGGEVTKLNGALIEGFSPYAATAIAGDVTPSWLVEPPDGGDVLRFRVSPDGHRVVYLADQETDQQPELFSVPVEGGEPTKLNRPLDEGLRILEEFEFSPDGSSIVFLTGEEDGGPADLFQVSMDNRGVVKLDESFRLYAVGDEPRFRFSGDRLLFRSQNADATVVTLRSAALDGSAAVELSHNGKVSEFDVTAGGRQVVYLADPTYYKQFELFVVPITGGRSEKLSSATGRVAPSYRGNLGLATTSAGRVVYLADHDVANQYGVYASTIPEQPDLLVTSFVPDSTGFALQFNGELNADRLNLYDAQSVGLGATDIVVEGAMTGAVTGSLALDSARKGARFIKSGGPFAADTYTVRLRSGLEGVQSADRYLLDGDGSGLAGNDFLTSFTIPTAERVVGLPDFVRGPGQSVSLRGSDVSGIPLSINEGAGVRTATLQIEYDPRLLSIDAATVGPEMPAGTLVTLDVSKPGTAVLSFNSPVGVPAGEQVLLYLQALVPESATDDIYGQHQILQLKGVHVADAAGNSLQVVADHALQVVSLFGDVSLNGHINALDASRVARVAARVDSGFAASVSIDPVIVADVSGNGVVNATDALHLFAALAGLDPADLPPSGPARDDAPETPPSPPPAPPWDSQIGSTRRLDDPRAISGDVVDFEFSPDGRFAVYTADSTSDHEFDLYGVELATGDVRKLSAAEEEGSLLDFQFSPDSQRVVYRTENAYELINLYSASLLGGGSSRLNDTLADGTVLDPLNRWTDPLLSPDGELVVYLADRMAEEDFQLFSVPIEGGTSTRLVGNLLDEGSLWEFEVTVDGGYRLFLRDKNWRDSAELFFSNSAGELRSTDTPSFKTSPDGKWDVYIDGDSGDLYSMLRGGNGATKLNGELYNSRDRVEEFLISPDSEHVFYVAEQESYRGLYRVPIAGGDFSELSGGSKVSTGIQISPDGSRVVYLQRSELRSAPAMGGGGSTLLSGSLDPSWGRFQISPDSQWVVFHARRGRTLDADRTYGIYSVPLTGGSYVALTATPTYTGVGKFAFAPDSQWVVYLAEQDVAGAFELYRMPVIGGASSRLSAPHLSRGGTVTEIQASADGRFLVYRADHDVDDVFELYAVSTVTGGMVKLSGPPVAGSVEADFMISADGTRVVYQAKELVRVSSSTSVFRSGLYSVRLTGGGTVRLTRPLLESAIEDYEISTDGSRVVYQARLEHSSGTGLFSVPLLGGAVTRLDTAGAAWRFQTSPDSSYVVYQVESREMYSVPIGGGPSVKLNGPLARRSSVVEFQISPDGTRVVYTTREGHLYSALSTGGEYVSLSSPFGAVQDFQFTPDGKTVLFRAGQRPVRLFSVSLTGGKPNRLSDPVAGEVQPYPLISGDGKRVLYLMADRARDHTDATSTIAGDLYSVPITGGESTVLADSAKNVQFGYKITPDGRTVVYRADQDADDVFEVYAMPISGGESTKLNAPLPVGGDVSQFTILPIYNWLVYLADQDADEQVGIYRTLIPS